MRTHAFDYRDLHTAPLELTSIHEEFKATIRRFAMENLRPAAIELDKLQPEDVVREGSLFWQNMRRMHELGYHTIFIPEEFGGIGFRVLATRRRRPERPPAGKGRVTFRRAILF